LQTGKYSLTVRDRNAIATVRPTLFIYWCVLGTPKSVYSVSSVRQLFVVMSFIDVLDAML